MLSKSKTASTSTLLTEEEDRSRHKDGPKHLLGHQLLAEDFGDAAAAESYKTACKPLFPISTYFGTGAPRPPAEEAKTEAEVPDVPGQTDGKKK